MGLPPGDTKEQPFRSVIAILDASGAPYTVIGGVAVQLYSSATQLSRTCVRDADGFSAPVDDTLT
jgi:hypothetical protein